MELKAVIRSVQDFPKEGILFRDITTVLQNPEALKISIDKICTLLEGVEFDYILGPESRGFIFGMPVAYKLNKGFIPIRKEGKLPSQTVKKTYDLEYGSATIEMHTDAIKKGDRVVIIDDLLATGGTCKAITELMADIGAQVVKMIFFIELEDLDGRKVLEGYDIDTIVKYE